MEIIPLQPIPSQTFVVPIGGQRCRLNLYEKVAFLQTSGNGAATTTEPMLYLDITVNDVLLLAGVPCLNGVRMVRDAYLGFVGDLAFHDTQGADDPLTAGLGTRWLLVYLD